MRLLKNCLSDYRPKIIFTTRTISRTSTELSELISANPTRVSEIPQFKYPLLLTSSRVKAITGNDKIWNIRKIKNRFK